MSNTSGQMSGNSHQYTTQASLQTSTDRGLSGMPQFSAVPQERNGPRISINKLGEYLVATPGRRRTIIAAQKRPSDFIVIRYREAVEAITAFLELGAQDEALIIRAIQQLESKQVTSDFQDQDRDLSIQALESFLDITDAICVQGATIARGEPAPPQLIIEGVNVSARPEIVLTAQDRSGNSAVGVIKLYLSKSFPLTTDAGEYIGALLQQYATEHLSANGRCDYRMCQTIDVFARQIHLAPRAHIRRRSDIQAACQEIARAWNSA